MDAVHPGQSVTTKCDRSPPGQRPRAAKDNQVLACFSTIDTIAIFWGMGAMQLLLPIVIPMSPTLDTRDETLARIFAVDQHGYVNASELARWINGYRKALGMKPKEMKYPSDFKIKTGRRVCAEALGWEICPKG